MELNVKPQHKNSYPLAGVFIKSPEVASWIKEIQLMNLSLGAFEIYPLPDTKPNSIWGCLLLMHEKLDTKQLRGNEAFQIICQRLCIPEKTIIEPIITDAEILQLTGNKLTVFHPDFGWVAPEEKVDLEHLVMLPKSDVVTITQAAAPAFIPTQIRSFSIKAVDPNELLKNMEEKVFPKKEKIPEKPLSLWEKAKLLLYKNVLGTPAKRNKGQTSDVHKNPDRMLARLLRSIGIDGEKIAQRIDDDFEDLEERNKTEMEKLLKMLRENPEEALKYAIPLDNNGSFRGGDNGSFHFGKRWCDFSLFGQRNNSGNSGSVNVGDHIYELQLQYNATAEALIAQHEYQKAAFVYLKLLQNNFKAAETLEKGNLYQEAAMIYLKYEMNKQKAAECYEKGKMFDEAIELYEELKQYEKVGDLYSGLHKKDKANIFYTKVVDDYTAAHQYVKASFIYKHKMDNRSAAQELLLIGWKNSKDAFNCLNNYFENMDDLVELRSEMNHIYKELTPNNRLIFLNAIRYEFNKKNELSEGIKEMAYEIVAAHIETDPGVVAELRAFNKNDKELLKDTMKFSLQKKSANFIIKK